jgi:hypothetical protein
MGQFVLPIAPPDVLCRISAEGQPVWVLISSSLLDEPNHP